MQPLAHRPVYHGDLLCTQFCKCGALSKGIITLVECARGADRVAVWRFGSDRIMALSAWSSLRPHCDELATDQPFIGSSYSAFRHRVPRAPHFEESWCPGAHCDLTAASVVGPQTGSRERREGGRGIPAGRRGGLID